MDPGLRRDDNFGLARRLLRGGGALDEGVDRGADWGEERARVDAHPQHQQEERREYSLLARAQIEDAAQILAGDRAEYDPAIEVEHVHRAEKQRGRGEEAFERRNPECTQEDQELTDKPAGPGQ